MAERLGVADELGALVTPTRGFYVAHVGPDGQLQLVVSSDAFSNVPPGLRLTRYDLWRTLLTRAVALGAEIRYDCTVVGVEGAAGHGPKAAGGPAASDANSVTVLLASGERVVMHPSDRVADGGRVRGG